MKPTDEQVHILDLATKTGDNVIINASAGTGKSSTLKLIERALPKQNILYVVFARRDADEAKKEMLSTTVVNTANGTGAGIWKQSIAASVTLNTKKSQDLFRVLISETPKKLQSEMWDRYWEVIHGVGIAKNLGYVPNATSWPTAEPLVTRDEFLHSSCLEEAPDDITADLIDALLTRSIKAAYAGSIDFNDQVYMPAVFGGAFPRFPIVFVDEYQDLNPVNHALVKRLVHGRIFGVGDEAQNIFAFRGAKPKGMEYAKAQYNMTAATLTVSFRCPQRVVEAARWRVPNFKWIKPGGHVERLRDMGANDFPESAAIVCRNNAPLYKLGMQLLGEGRSIKILGSDIGPRIIAVMRKLGHDDLNRDGTLGAIESWRDDKLSKESTTANDFADTMKVFAEKGDCLGQAIRYAENIFKQEGPLKLMTGHKSKGSEHDNVYMLDPSLVREDDQDRNLRYVMQTRSADRLYEINSDAIAF